MQKDWTGERLETHIFNHTTIEHLHRYAFLIDFVKDKIVLDIASGEGYGSHLIAQHAKNVIGVDIDFDVIDAAKRKYNRSNLEFRQGQADNIPVKSNSVDVVVSFETIEHHDKHHEMMREVTRALKKDGLLIISSPDKEFYSDKRNFVNKFHLKELYAQEFKDLIKTYFSHCVFYRQNIFIGSLLIREESNTGFKVYRGDYKQIQDENFSPLYILAVASNQPFSNDESFSGFSGLDIITEENHRREEEVRNTVRFETKKWIENSMSYRIGHMLVGPLKFLFGRIK